LSNLATSSLFILCIRVDYVLEILGNIRFSVAVELLDDFEHIEQLPVLLAHLSILTHSNSIVFVCVVSRATVIHNYESLQQCSRHDDLRIHDVNNEIMAFVLSCTEQVPRNLLKFTFRLLLLFLQIGRFVTFIDELVDDGHILENLAVGAHFTRLLVESVLKEAIIGV